MNDQLKNSLGFTLIEVLIAIVLLAFISLYTYKMVDTNLDTKDQVLKEDRLLLQTLTAISRIDSDFNQIYSPLYSSSKVVPTDDSNQVYQDNSVPKGQFDGKTKNGNLIPQFQSPDKSTLIFFSASNRRKIADAKDSRYNWVKYSIRNTDDSGEGSTEPKSSGNQELVRQTISTNIYSDDLNWNNVKAQILLTHIKSLEFSFWDERTKKYLTSILELNENKNLIRSIRLNLVWIDEDNHEQKIEKTFRILYPFFNSKADDLKNGAYNGGAVPPGLPDPGQVTGGEDEKHF